MVGNFKILGQTERIKGLGMRSLVVKIFGKNRYFVIEIVKPRKNKK